MRTTLDIDEHLMEALMARHPGTSKTKAVEAAIADHVRRGAVDWLLENAGKIEIEDVSEEMRAIDRRILAWIERFDPPRYIGLGRVLPPGGTRTLGDARRIARGW